MNWILFKSQDSYLVSRVSLRVLKIVLRLLTAILSYFFFLRFAENLWQLSEYSITLVSVKHILNSAEKLRSPQHFF